MESLYRKKGGLMLETAADNASILSIDLGLLIGLLVLLGLLDPSLGRDRILFGTTVASLPIMYALWRWHDTLSAIRDFRAELLAVFVLCLRSGRHCLHVDVHRHPWCRCFR
jgi:hypothetical protein